MVTLAATLCGACSSSTITFTDDRVSVNATVFSVTDVAEVADTAMTQYRVTVSRDGERISDARVLAGAPGQLVELQLDDSGQGFSDVRQGYPADHEFVVEVAGERLQCSLRGPTFFTVELDPLPTMNTTTDVTWDPSNEPGIYAGVRLGSPTLVNEGFPPSGVGDDDGSESLPASMFADPGAYQLHVERGHRQLVNTKTSRGDLMDCDAWVQRNLDFEIP